MPGGAVGMLLADTEGCGIPYEDVRVQICIYARHPASPSPWQEAVPAVAVEGARGD